MDARDVLSYFDQLEDGKPAPKEFDFSGESNLDYDGGLLSSDDEEERVCCLLLAQMCKFYCFYAH